MVVYIEAPEGLENRVAGMVASPLIQVRPWQETRDNRA
jgi:hypothetical protein